MARRLSTTTLVALAVAAGLLGSTASSTAADSEVACAVTIANGRMPRSGAGVNHGNGSLWVGLSRDGVTVPGHIGQDGSLLTKFPWYRGVRGRLRITGARLDAAAPAAVADVPRGYGDRGFQASGIAFPSEGCWRVTGAVGRARLTFVTLVAPPAPHPES